MQKKKNRKKFYLKRWQTLLAICVIAGFILLLEMNLQPAGIIGVLKTFYHGKKLVVLNVFPLIAFVSFFYLLIGNVCWAGAVTTALFGGLSYANLLKIEGRDDALTPADFGLVREALGAARDYELDMHWGKALLFVLLLAALIVLGFYIKNSMRSFKVRFVLACATLLMFRLCIPIYQDNDLYYSFKVETRYNVALEYNTLGFNYCFFHNYNLYPVEKPEGFAKSDYDALMKASSTEHSGVNPNVIFVMCEAFSDLANEPMFSYTPDNTPLKEFHELCARPAAVSGKIAVSNYAAGTANTEFNIMTGMQTNSIGNGLTSSFRVLKDDTVSIASVLHDAGGYDTFFMHPGQSWFYNRQNVYKYFGIKDQIFQEAFDESDFKGNMISDAAFFDELTHDFETRLVENDKPLFTYAVTIQNHQAYSYDKYSFKPEDVPLNIEVSDDTQEALCIYMEGIRDSSKLALDLADYVDSLDEPTLLVFYGDHRPNLGNSYVDLGLNYMEGGSIETYEVPFVIYPNAALTAAEDMNAAFKSCNAENGMIISDNYLGAMVLKLIGYGDCDPFFGLLNSIKDTSPLYRLDPPDSGTYDTALGEDVCNLLHGWTYYRIKY